MVNFQCPVCGAGRDSASADCMSCGWHRRAEGQSDLQCPVCGVERESASADCMSCGWRPEAEPDSAEVPSADQSTEDILVGTNMTRGDVMWIVVRIAGVYCLVLALSALARLAFAIFSYATSTHSGQGRAWPVITAGIPLLVYFIAGMYLLRRGQLIVGLACGEKQDSRDKGEEQVIEEAAEEDADVEDALPADQPQLAADASDHDDDRE